jgi:hypothetical protein
MQAPDLQLGMVMGKPKLLNLPGATVPIARYFIFVGGTLAALLFVAGWCLPTSPAMFADQPLAIDRAIIRIKSARKWPKKSRPGHEPPDNNTPGYRGAFGGTVDPAAV